MSADEVQRKRRRCNASSQNSNETSLANRLRQRNRLCTRCRSINFDSILRTSNSIATTPSSSSTIVYQLGDLQQSMVNSPCPLCRMLAAICPWKRNSTKRAFALRAFSAVKYEFPNTRGKKDVQDTVILTIAPSNVTRLNPNQARRASATIYTTDHSKGSQDQRILGNAINPLRVDYGMAVDWIRYCKAHHRGYCRFQRSKMVYEIPRFKLIDCQSRKVIESSPRKEYAALSYVWGSGASRLSTRSLPNPAPRVIEDAMTVTQNIGLRYLWVDRYCISQTNAAEKHDQIAKMDQIYAGAEVTIAAAAGEGPDYGLPGVSKTPRRTQPSAVVHNHHLVSSLRPPRDVVLSSMWASRAWTFQEAILSRRVLYFTDDQIFFECASMNCQETVRMPLAAVHQNWSASMGRECDSKRIFPPKRSGEFASDILSTIHEYTTRNLSYPSDNLNALLGVFNTFADEHHKSQTSVAQSSSRVPNSCHRTQVHNLWGIPILPRTIVDDYEGKASLTRRLTLVLGWRCLSPSARCSDFPSWSWAGWSLPSKVYFPIHRSGGRVDIFNPDPEVNILLRLNTGRTLSCEEFEEQLGDNKNLGEISKILILEGKMVEMSFTRTQDSTSPLKPVIKGAAGCNIRFSPNLKLDTESELMRFTERKWEAIIISSAVMYFPPFTMLVVQRVGKAYERVGIAWAARNSTFQNLPKRQIELQ